MILIPHGWITSSVADISPKIVPPLAPRVAMAYLVPRYRSQHSRLHCTTRSARPGVRRPIMS
jgi:hypothetical protein